MSCWPGYPVANGHAHVISNFKWPLLRPYLGTVCTLDGAFQQMLLFQLTDTILLLPLLAQSIYFVSLSLYAHTWLYEKKQKKQCLWGGCTVPLGFCCVLLDSLLGSFLFSPPLWKVRMFSPQCLLQTFPVLCNLPPPTPQFIYLVSLGEVGQDYNGLYMTYIGSLQAVKNLYKQLCNKRFYKQ